MAVRLPMSRHLLEVIERDHSRIAPSGRVVMHDGEPVIDDGPPIQAIAHRLRVQEREARLMGLDEPTQRAVDVITHDMFMEAVAELKAVVARKEAALASREGRPGALTPQTWTNAQPVTGPEPGRAAPAVTPPTGPGGRRRSERHLRAPISTRPVPGPPESGARVGRQGALR